MFTTHQFISRQVYGSTVTKRYTIAALPTHSVCLLCVAAIGAVVVVVRVVFVVAVILFLAWHKRSHKQDAF